MTRCITTLAYLVATLGVAMLGCSVDRSTQITVALSSEAEIPKELDEFYVRVTATRTGSIRFENTYKAEDGHVFPTTLAVIPYDEDSLGSPVAVYLEGRKGGVPFLARRAIVSYVKDRNILLTMPLRMACFEFRDCGPTATCSGGQCVEATVDPRKAIDYKDSMVFGASGACFDEQACLAGGTEVAVSEDCTFTIPDGVAEGQGNVSIRWAAAPERVLGLDSGDAQEGWVRVSATQGRLSQGACDSHFQRTDSAGRKLVSDWAKAVYFAPACASKTPQFPHCFSTTTRNTGVGAVVAP